MANDIGKAIRNLRGLDSQEMLAERLGVSRITVTRWESGEAVPSLRHARQLVALGLDAELFLQPALAAPSGEVA
jgi:transcriptional regulator with XRE-family HTH domain